MHTSFHQAPFFLIVSLIMFSFALCALVPDGSRFPERIGDWDRLGSLSREAPSFDVPHQPTSCPAPLFGGRVPLQTQPAKKGCRSFFSHGNPGDSLSVEMEMSPHPSYQVWKNETSGLPTRPNRAGPRGKQQTRNPTLSCSVAHVFPFFCGPPKMVFAKKGSLVFFQGH